MPPIPRDIDTSSVRVGGKALALDRTGQIPLAVRKLLPGYEYSYTEFTAPVAVNATTEATANTIVTAPALILDGLTTIWVKFFAPYIETGSGAGVFVVLDLYDNGASIGKNAAAQSPATGTLDAPLGLAQRRLTPSPGSHTYSMRAHEGGGAGTVFAGVGGIGNQMPGFIQIVRA